MAQPSGGDNSSQLQFKTQRIALRFILFKILYMCITLVNMVITEKLNDLMTQLVLVYSMHL